MLQNVNEEEDDLMLCNFMSYHQVLELWAWNLPVNDNRNSFVNYIKRFIRCQNCTANTSKSIKLFSVGHHSKHPNIKLDKTGNVLPEN